MRRLSRAQVLLGLSGLCIVAGAVFELLREPVFSETWYVAAALAGLIFIAPHALTSLKKHMLDMNCLMGIAVIGALCMGFVQSRHGVIQLDTFRDGAIVIFLYQIGEWLEDWSRERSSASLKELESLAPTVAFVKDADGGLREVPLSEISRGDVIEIRPGARVPLDGEVLAGASDVDESSITGESALAAKAPGATVYAGSLNTQGTLSVRVSAALGQTVLDGIISQVEAAEKNRAPYEAFVTRFARVYTPCVVLVAAIVGLGVPCVLSLFGQTVSWAAWIWRALSMLVIACPCALVISTPVAFVSAISKAAKRGILVKGGAAFDVGSKVSAVALDKTGTITRGTPHVTDVIAYAEFSEARVLALAAALEETSSHPLARAVCEAADKVAGGEIPSLSASHVSEKPGFGVFGTVDGCAVSVTKPTSDLAGDADALLAAGKSVLVVHVGEVLAGFIAAQDVSRRSSRQAVEELRESGYQTMLLSGDNEASTQAVAAQVGIAEAHGGLLPAQKVEAIKRAQAEGDTVCMVGDGINDGPALAAADLSVTMGHDASDTALSISQVALLGADLCQLVNFFKLSKRTMRVARENIAFALCVKGLVLCLSAAGLAGMGAAIFADTGVMLLVVLNGLRLML